MSDERYIPMWFDAFDLKRVQEACNLINGANLVVDGVYGPATKAAVAALQTKFVEPIRRGCPCTCQWSPVDTATIDPPHIVKINRDCPHHGREAPPEPDPDEAYERKRDDAQFFRDIGDDYE